MGQKSGVLDSGAVEWGRLSKSVAGSANVTLVAAEYENRVLELTGALTGSIQLILPLLDGREWEVYNNTSGAFTLTVIGASGTGVVISQGYRAVVRTDGVNVYRVTPDTKNDGSLAGAPTGTATATAGTATLNAQSGTITSETGLTTAAGADYVLTLTNSFIAATSKVLATADNGTNTTEGVAINRVTVSAGQVIVRVRNTHASSAWNGSVKVNFLVIP